MEFVNATFTLLDGATTQFFPSPNALFISSSLPSDSFSVAAGATFTVPTSTLLFFGCNVQLDGTVILQVNSTLSVDVNDGVQSLIISSSNVTIASGAVLIANAATSNIAKTAVFSGEGVLAVGTPTTITSATFFSGANIGVKLGQSRSSLIHSPFRR